MISVRKPIWRRLNALQSDYEPPTRVDPGGCAAIHFGSLLNLFCNLSLLYACSYALNRRMYE
jgi:hypothetical protein